LGYSNFGFVRLFGLALGCARLAPHAYPPSRFPAYKLQPKAAGGRLRPGVGARQEQWSLSAVCALTVHSSRTRFVAANRAIRACPVFLHYACRLNSGVRAQRRQIRSEARSARLG